jgi:hypothetical protein
VEGVLFTIAVMKWDLRIGIKIPSSQSEFTIPIRKKYQNCVRMLLRIVANIPENSTSDSFFMYSLFTFLSLFKKLEEILLSVEHF